MKQIEAQIMGQGYVLGCPEDGEDRLMRAVERVDAAMCKIRDAGRVKARERIAVLAALNLAFELIDSTLSPTSGAVRPAPDERAMPDMTDAPVAQDASGQAALARLLDRIDQAMGEDGQLL